MDARIVTDLSGVSAFVQVTQMLTCVQSVTLHTHLCSVSFVLQVTGADPKLVKARARAFYAGASGVTTLSTSGERRAGSMCAVVVQAGGA